MNKSALLALAAIVPAVGFADSDSHYVYTLLNQAGGNAVQIYRQNAGGQLIYVGQSLTGGHGTGKNLGTQNSLSLSEDGRFLLAVNAGDNSISVFYRDEDRLVLTDVEPSQGVSPASVTQHDGLVYVLNQGSATQAGNIQGFVRFRGGLIPIPGATAPLSATGVIPVEIQFTPDGRGLVVPEKTSNLIDTYNLDYRGLPTAWSFQPSNGPTPFGFDFDKEGRLFITEAFGGASNASSVSSYWLDHDLGLHTISQSVSTKQTAACWDVVSPNGKFLFTGNTGSGNLTGYRIAEDGSVSLLKQSGISAITGGATVDLSMRKDGKYLYALTHDSARITVFEVDDRGNLMELQSVGNLPVGTSGLVAR